MKPFSPHPLMSSPHLQTIGVNLFLSREGIAYTRHRVETPDGDFFDLDAVEVQGVTLPPDAPALLVVHGLEGDARRGYMCATYRAMAAVGIRCVGMNLRSCSGEINRFGRSYHLGATDDVALALDWLRQHTPGPYALMGFSLGGNLTVKFVGERGDTLAGMLAAAVAVSPPFDATRTARLNAFPNTIYRRYLLAGLKAKAQAKAALIAAEGGSMAQALAARTLKEYDSAVTAPLHGFRDADDYYAQASCGPFVPGIRIPALLIRSVDDPFFYDDIPYEAVAANPSITGLFTRRGGHCGFLEGWRPGAHHAWAQATAALWLRQHLLPA